MTTTEAIKTNARKLRLSGLADSLEIRLQEAMANQLSHAEFLQLLLTDEHRVRTNRAFERRKKRAAFREIRRLEDFDFSFNPSLSRAQIYDLATGQYIRERRDILMMGPPGVGKSHLVQALGYQAVKDGHEVAYVSIFDLIRDLREEAELRDQSVLKKYLKCELLIIDDMGIKQMGGQSGEYLFEIILRRHELRSTIMTTNRPISDWGRLLGDVPSATAILDRFLHRSEVIQITGKSYRLGKAEKAGASPCPESEASRENHITEIPEEKSSESESLRIAQSVPEVETEANIAISESLEVAKPQEID